MKKFNFLYLLLFISSFLFLSSCDKDEDPKDLRDDIVGTYNYRIKFYETQQGFGYLGSEYDAAGTMIATKGTGTIDNEVIQFKEGGELLFTAVKFKEDNDGIAFDLVNDTDIVEGQNVTITGVNKINLNNVDYHGAYFYNSKKVNAAQQVSYLSDGVPVTIVADIEATKQ
ncbi:hypothetical protein ACE193_15120 [Bernardetia sp. OM2101]|uniref:hypothetical protein n=1 Tax=Bernardetia sp. OM2101 TaxID=3344876 RepID=UPI0035D1281A